MTLITFHTASWDLIEERTRRRIGERVIMAPNTNYSKEMKVQLVRELVMDQTIGVPQTSVFIAGTVEHLLR